MERSIGETEFAVLVRRSGVPLDDEDVARLREGYALLERLLADLSRPADAAVEPASVFAPLRET